VYHSLTKKWSIDLKNNRSPISIPSCGLVSTHTTITEALEYAVEFIGSGRSGAIQKDVMIAVQMIQNTLSEHYDVYDRRPEHNPPKVDSSNTE